MFNSGHDGRSTAEHFGKKRAVIGDRGEDYFGKALVNSGLDKFSVYRSLGIPAKGNQTRLRGDVDCVVANSDRVVLIDVKRWAGDYLWTLPFTNRPMRGLGPLMMQKTKGGPLEWKLSGNMAAAQDRYSAALPHAHVTSMVAFAPTNDRDRNSGPKNVQFLVWDGGIKSFTIGEALTELKLRLGPEVVQPLSEITHLLTGLQIHK